MIQPDWKNECTFLGVNEIRSTSGYSPADCESKSKLILLNKVAELGGNAYVITDKSVSACLTGGTRILFEAYACPTK